MTRKQIAAELLRGCDPESLVDHQALAAIAKAEGR